MLSGGQEAELTALGVISGVHRADGVVGDLGGGSLELVDVRGTRARHGVTRPLGGLALADISAKSVKKAEKFVKKSLNGLPVLKACEDRTFYAVGGTWRSLARLHMWQTGYPLHVMHGYAIPADEALEFAKLVHRVDVDTLSNIEVVNNARRPLLPYARAGAGIHPARRQAAAGGVLGARRARRPALFAAQEEGQGEGRADRGGAPPQPVALALAAARRGIDRLDRPSSSPPPASRKPPRRRRLRHAACLLADIGWRAHPDYRGEQSLNIIAHGGFSAIDHQGRAYLALSVFFRHVGLVMDDELSPRLRELVSTPLCSTAPACSARRFGWLMWFPRRCPACCRKRPLAIERHRLALRLPGDYAALAGERVMNRLRSLARLIGREPVLLMG